MSNKKKIFIILSIIYIIFLIFIILDFSRRSTFPWQKNESITLVERFNLKKTINFNVYFVNNKF